MKYCKKWRDTTMFEKVIPLINEAHKIGIFTHITPDGDAMGSAYGLKLALESLGKECRVFLNDSPDRPAYDLMKKGPDTELQPSDCDLLVALDSADIGRLGKFGEIFSEHKNTIAIDHHITHVKYASSGTVVCEISSTCELLCTLRDEIGVELTKDIANDLYIGIATDTGSFKYSSVSGDTLRTAARLVDTGIPFSYLTNMLFDTKTFEYYDLLKTALSKLKLRCGGRVALMYLSEDDFKNADIDEAHAAGIVNIPGSIKGVKVGVYIRHRASGEYKISLRSNNSVDVSAVAAHFGGGGHVRASGYSVRNKSVQQICSELIGELEKIWQD